MNRFAKQPIAPVCNSLAAREARGPGMAALSCAKSGSEWCPGRASASGLHVAVSWREFRRKPARPARLEGRPRSATPFALRVVRAFRGRLLEIGHYVVKSKRLKALGQPARWDLEARPNLIATTGNFFSRHTLEAARSDTAAAARPCSEAPYRFRSRQDFSHRSASRSDSEVDPQASCNAATLYT